MVAMLIVLGWSRARPRSSRAAARAAHGRIAGAPRGIAGCRVRHAGRRDPAAGYLGLAPPGTAVDGASPSARRNARTSRSPAAAGRRSRTISASPVVAVDAALPRRPAFRSAAAHPDGRYAAATDTLVIRHAAVEPSPPAGGPPAARDQPARRAPRCGRKRAARRRRAPARPRSRRVLRQQRLDRASRLAVVAPQAAGRRDAARIPGRGTRERHCRPADCGRPRRPRGCGHCGGPLGRPGGAGEERRAAGAAHRTRGTKRRGRARPARLGRRKRVSRVVELRNGGVAAVSAETRGRRSSSSLVLLSGLGALALAAAAAAMTALALAGHQQMAQNAFEAAETGDRRRACSRHRDARRRRRREVSPARDRDGAGRVPHRDPRGAGPGALPLGLHASARTPGTFAARHFFITADGESGRGARQRLEQGFYFVVPSS